MLTDRDERVARCAGLAVRNALDHRDEQRVVEEVVVRTTLRELGVREAEIDEYAVGRFGVRERASDVSVSRSGSYDLVIAVPVQLPPDIDRVTGSLTFE